MFGCCPQKAHVRESPPVREPIGSSPGRAMPPTRIARPLPKAGRLLAPTSLRVGHTTGAFPCKETPPRFALTDLEQPEPGDI